jgi:hypothetical protein
VKWLKRQWLRLWRSFRPTGAPFGITLVDDLPDELRQRIVYLAGEGRHLWCAALVCPCGCGEVIRLNLLKDARPCWGVNEHPDGTVSIQPSVWREKGCRSHFFVRRGMINWC